jgi:hypothetical protein
MSRAVRVAHQRSTVAWPSFLLPDVLDPAAIQTSPPARSSESQSTHHTSGTLSANANACVSSSCNPLLNTGLPPIIINLRVFTFCSPCSTSENDPLQVGAALLLLVVTYGPLCHDLAFFCIARDQHLGPHLSPSRSPSMLHVPARD